MKFILMVSMVLLLTTVLLPVVSVADNELVYGWQLMTEQERNEYRMQMRTLDTEQEREDFRRQHHEQMDARAKAQGVTLPEEPRVGRGSPGIRGGQGQGPDR